MYSRDYVRKRLMSGAKRRKTDYYGANLMGLFSFLLISILAAPVIHEAAHMALFDYFGCPYRTEFSLTKDYNVRGEIDPSCDLSRRDTVYVLAAGVFVNLVLAALLFMTASLLHFRCMLTHANYVMYLALGFLMDPLFYSFAMEGDIVNVLSVIGKTDWIEFVPVLGIALFSLAVAYYYFYTESFMEDYMRMEAEVERAEAFISEIRS